MSVKKTKRRTYVATPPRNILKKFSTDVFSSAHFLRAAR